jgi:putative oxidoreductase
MNGSPNTSAFLFIQHGLEKLWGFAGGRIDRDFSSIHGIAGLIETPGRALVDAGPLHTDPGIHPVRRGGGGVFPSWAPRGFWPITNGGEGSVVYCYIFLWLVTAGDGPWSLDALIQRNFQRVRVVASWETSV